MSFRGWDRLRDFLELVWSKNELLQHVSQKHALGLDPGVGTSICLAPAGWFWDKRYAKTKR